LAIFLARFFLTLPITYTGSVAAMLLIGWVLVWRKTSHEDNPSFALFNAAGWNFAKCRTAVEKCRWRD